jgi:hypothetical protein
MLAGAPSLWSQAVINEVYALQALLFALFLFLRTREGHRPRALSAFVAGLAFANHQSALFLSPFLVADVWRQRRSLHAWVAVFGLGLLGVSLYLYLPIRSAQRPLLDWGGTHRIPAFLRHITGWQYKNWVGLGNLQEYGSALGFAFGHVARNVAFVGLPLAAFGWWRLRTQTPTAGWASLWAFVLCLAFGVNFPNPDLEAFYMLPYVLCAGWAGMGLWTLARRSAVWGSLASAAVVACTLVQVWVVYPAANLREFRVPTQWVEDALATIEPGAVVLTREWDHYAPWLYLRIVKGVRPDVTWIDTELLRRSWYPEFIRRVDSTRYQAASPALARLAPEIGKFEAGLPYRPEEIERAYADAIYDLALGQPGPVYVDGIAGSQGAWGVERVYLRAATEVPWGLTMRLFRPGETVSPPPAWRSDYQDRPPTPYDSPRTRLHLELYRRMREARARYPSSG